MRLLFWIIIALAPFIGNSQAYDDLSKPNSYRSAENPNYWKNKMPREEYWQQDVHYTIKADIDETSDIITASQKLEYWNNSPADLNFVYFHLYQNAFQPDSYYDNLQENNKKKPKYSEYESAKKGTEILNISISGKELKTELDNTILKVWLDEPLKTGESIRFDIEFKTYFGGGSVRRRMKKFNSSGFTHYDGVHWYPRICVYDRKFGWTTDQHLGKEFYGDFGTFDVELTFSSNYIVDGTGFMTNRNEMLPLELREKLDIKNFATKPWNEKASIITTYDSLAHKTWIFHAENVHDFAFTADPTYRIGEAEWNGKKCIALVQEPHALGWQNAAEYTAKIIETFSNEIGMYTYHKMIVADAKDGMEYPMLTLDGGYDPSYRGLFIHEVGHNWFFGQVGNNETYRAALDEGFTQFLTSYGAEKIEGDTVIQNLPRSKYKQRYRKKNLTRYRNVYFGYLRDAMKNKDPQLNTHSDAFNGALGHGGGYGHVYYKTATMLYNLQYVLGDELFIASMQNYFSEWKIAHPYFEDFRNSIINYTKVDLNWFFDQWLETTKSIDYGIKSIQRGTEENEFIITFKRNGRMQMPIDFNVKARNGKTATYHIPNTWFEKETDATILPRWIGWDKVQPTYDANIIVPSGIENIRIDTTNRLADINMLNNSNRLPVEFHFDHKIANLPDIRYYELKSRPDLWYNGFDGLKAGFHLNGSYMNYKHKFDLNLWMNSGLFNQVQSNQFDYVSYRFNYSTPTDNFILGSTINFSTKYLDGLIGNKIGFEKKSNSEKSKVYAYFKSMYRPDSSDVLYLINPYEWSPLKWNNTVNLGINHRYKSVKGSGEINLLTKSSSLGSDYNYSLLSVELINQTNLGKLVLRTRFFGQLGTGNNWAPESQLYFAGSNQEDMMDNKYMRSTGFIAHSWEGYGVSTNHLHYGGGLNLRGYAGYLGAVEMSDGSIRNFYKNSTGAAFNVELEFDQLIGWNPSFLRNYFDLDCYLFGDIGTINYNYSNESIMFIEPRADAGIGTSLTIQRWGALELVKPLTIRVDVPFYLSHAPYVEENIDFRWIIGINRSF